MHQNQFGGQALEWAHDSQEGLVQGRRDVREKRRGWRRNIYLVL